MVNGIPRVNVEHIYAYSNEDLERIRVLRITNALIEFFRENK